MPLLSLTTTERRLFFIVGGPCPVLEPTDSSAAVLIILNGDAGGAGDLRVVFLPSCLPSGFFLVYNNVRARISTENAYEK